MVCADKNSCFKFRGGTCLQEPNRGHPHVQLLDRQVSRGGDQQIVRIRK